MCESKGRNSMTSYPGPSFDTACVKAEQLRSIYDKAKDDLDAIWPVYWQWAQLKDERAAQAEQAEYDKQMAHYESEKARLKKARDQVRDRYNAELVAWENSSRICRGRRPEEPLYAIDCSWWLRPPMPNYSSHAGYTEKIRAEDVRQEVDNMAKLARSGPDEFHMTQTQLSRMLRWAEGAVIADIKARMESAISTV